MSHSSIGEGIGLVRQQVAKQSLSHQDRVTASRLLDAYGAQLQSLGIAATTVSARSASSMPRALKALNGQVAAASGLNGYQQGAARDLTTQLVAELAAHNVTVTS